MKTTAFVVRHGSIENPKHLLYGRLPGFPLSKLGKKQVRIVADKLAKKNIQAVFYSPLLRTKQTATAIAAKSGAPMFPSKDLIESDFYVQGRKMRDPVVQIAIKNGHNPYREPAEKIVARMKRVLFKVLEGKRRRVALVSHMEPIAFLTKSLSGGKLDGVKPNWPDRTGVVQLEFDGRKLLNAKYFAPHRFK